VVSAFDFLVVGYFSDRTRSRWGRRIPYIVTGAPLASVFAVLVFVAPPDAGTAATAVYFFVALELMFLFTALGNGPYDALLPELAQTSDERVRLQTYKVYLGVAGTGLGLLGSDLLVHAFGFRVMAVVIAAVAL